jgi:hypothetical protein
LPPNRSPMRRPDVPESHEGDFGFLQANPQLYRTLVKSEGRAALGPAAPALGRPPPTG